MLQSFRLQKYFQAAHEEGACKFCVAVQRSEKVT